MPLLRLLLCCVSLLIDDNFHLLYFEYILWTLDIPSQFEYFLIKELDLSLFDTLPLLLVPTDFVLAWIVSNCFSFHRQNLTPAEVNELEFVNSWFGCQLSQVWIRTLSFVGVPIYDVEILTDEVLVISQIQQLEMAECIALNHFESAIYYFKLLVFKRYHIRNLVIIIFSTEAFNRLLPQLAHIFFQSCDNLYLGHRNR